MPILSVGKANRNRSATSGVTLIELLIVVALIGLLAAISFPAVTSGIETLRLNAAIQSTVSFLNSGLNRAERRQQAVEVAISKPENVIWLHSTELGFERRLEMPEGVSITKVFPPIEDANTDGVRRFLLYPGGSVPGFGVQLENRKGIARVVRVDPVTGVPLISKAEP